jgi:hypothetical protein
MNLKTTTSALLFLLVAATACIDRTFQCHCVIDASDTTGVIVDYDTTIVIQAKREELADVQCQSYAGAASMLIPTGAPVQANVTCALQ